jgi:DNA-directed RNA polymerase subunit RPC12/RpoP
MSAGKIVGYVISGILIFFGVIWLWSAFAPDTGVNPVERLVVGVILVGIGLAIIVIIKMREPKPEQKVVVKIDLSGDIELEKLQCQNCGAELDKKSITLAQGAVVVSCPYCGTSYQMVEEPKW